MGALQPLQTPCSGLNNIECVPSRDKMKMIPKGTVIKIELDTGYCGMDTYTYYKLSQDYSEEELDNFAWDMALDNAEMYGIYPESTEDDDEDNPYSGENISGVWNVVEENEADIYDEIDTITL
jgi:hypothetical protein